MIFQFRLWKKLVLIRRPKTRELKRMKDLKGVFHYYTREIEFPRNDGQGRRMKSKGHHNSRDQRGDAQGACCMPSGKNVAFMAKWIYHGRVK